MAKTKRRGYQTAVQSICLMLDGAYMVLAAMLMQMFFENKMYKAEDIGAGSVLVCHSITLAAVDLMIWRWCNKGKRRPIAIGFMIKTSLFCIFFGGLYVTWDIPQAAVCFWSLGALLMLLAVWLFKSTNSMKSAFSSVQNAAYSFVGDSAAGYFQMAEREYFRLNGITQGSVAREGQHELIMRYAAMPIAYFMTWLADNDGYSEHFMVDEGNGKLVENVKNRTADPAELLLSQPNRALNGADLNDDMLGFATYYYDCRVSNNSQGYESRGWFSDFFTDADLHGEPIFCSEFSWPRYERLKKQLDSELAEYNRVTECIFYEDKPANIPKFYWQAADAEVTVLASGGASEEYVKRCVDELMSSEELAARFAETGEKTLCLEIYTPYGDETAYIIGCMSECLMMRGGRKICRFEDEAEEFSPWTRQADLKYRTIKQLSGIDLDEIDTPEKALAAGLVAVEQLPARFGGDPNSPENIMYLPPCVAGFKLKCDEVVAAAVCYGAANRYFCGPFIMGEGIVPKTFYVSANLGPQRIFHQRIDIYSR